MDRQKFLKTAVIYQMFLRPFTAEGTLSAAKERLPQIAELGADIVYVCPFFTADPDTDTRYYSQRMKKAGLSNPVNPYRISDFYQVDPEYGTEEDLRAFVTEAHRLGLLVMPDLVYLHCGINTAFMEEHPDYVQRDENGEIKLTEYGFPFLNFASDGLREYLFENMLYFVREFGVDGYRCDCGDSVPLDFWEEGVRRVRELKPDFMMLNEGDSLDAFRYAFDLNYGGPFTRSLRACVKGECTGAHLREVYEKLLEESASKNGSFILAIENHDFCNDGYDNRLEKQIPSSVMEGGLILCSLLPGTTFLYNGVEIADTRRHSIMGNRFNSKDLYIDWSCENEEKAIARRLLVKKLFSLRHTANALESDECRFVGEGNAIAFVRGAGEGSLFVAVNFDHETEEVEMPFNGETLLASGASIVDRRVTLLPGSYIVVRR